MPYAFVLLLMSALSAAAVDGDSAADRHFLDFVAPLLRSRCVSCHGPDKVKGGLRLDSRESILKAGDSGIPAIVPGKPNESLLLQAVTHSKKDLEMPPKEKLTTNDIAVLAQWIHDGAPWPESQGLGSVPPKSDSTERLGNAWDDPRNPIRRLFGGQRLELWSFKPVADPPPPAVRNQRWVRTPVDRFILANFEGRGISPNRKRAFRLGLLMTDTTEKVPPTHVLFQGDHKTPKDPVEPGFLSVLDPNPAAIHRGPNKTKSSRRSTLAEWIASAGNPLTARVFVNRVWQAYFGLGLVATANDFGLAGARPSHPQLLDWLATQFIRDGWSLRKLHRQIALSATYRQANRTQTSPSDSGPSPTLETSAPLTIVPLRNTRRLTAEQLRDALLAVSGLLAPRSGGPPVWPELPAEILHSNPAFLDDNSAKTKGWYQTAGPEQFARSIYLVQKKTLRVPFMETFDLPENSVLNLNEFVYID